MSVLHQVVVIVVIVVVVVAIVEPFGAFLRPLADLREQPLGHAALLPTE
jgi:hypothetical protein